jgi:hypothetical protein
MPSIDTSSIERLGETSAAWLACAWQPTQNAHEARLQHAFARAGERAYGLYLRLLFSPLARAMRAAGLAVYPPLPGGLADSREWGLADDSERQRWFWSCVVREDDEAPLGTLVTVLHHDHTRFRLPQPVQLFALPVARTAVVEQELGRMNGAFAAAAPLRLHAAYGAKAQP